MFSQKKKKFTYNAVVNKQFNPPARTRNLADAAFPDDFNDLSQTSKRQKLEENKKNGTDVNTKKKPDNGGCSSLENNNRNGFSSSITTTTKPLSISNNSTYKPKQANMKHVVVDPPKKSSENIISLDDDLQDDLMADDFDFTQAADEIDQIEIAASQMISTKKLERTRNNLLLLKDDGDSDILEELLSGSSMSLPPKTDSEDNFSLKIPRKKPPMPAQSNESSKEAPPKKQNAQIAKHNEMIKSKKEADNLQLLNSYKQKMVEAEQKYLSKDGEIKILRESLRKLTEEERKFKDHIQGLEHDLKTQQSDKEAKLVAEVEKLKTQLTFKEKEVQDAIEKHKKSSVTIASSPKSRKSPKVGFYSDAFDSIDRNKKRPVTPTKKIVNKTFNTTFLSKTFKNLFANTFSKTPSETLSLLKRIVKSSVEYEQCFAKLRLHCRHERPTEKENITSDFSTGLQSILDLVSSNSFFICEFVRKINCYLEDLYILLNSENDIAEEDNETRSDSDSENGEECIQCKTSYMNGLYSLKLLSSVPKIIHEYILNGLVKYMNRELPSETSSNRKTDIIIDNTKYYLKSDKQSEYLLVKDQTAIETETLCNVNLEDISYDTAKYLWKLIDDLILMRSHKNLEQLIFKLHLSLQFYPLSTSSEAHCAYLIENHSLSTHLSDLTADNILDVLKLLQNFISLKPVTYLICNKSDRCPLLLIYNWLINEDLLFKDTLKVLKVFQQLVSLLSTVIAFDQTLAYSFILDGEYKF